MEQETLEYRLKRLEEQSSEILASLNDLKSDLPSLYPSKEVYHSEMSDLERRVGELEKNKNTAFWAVISGGGALIVTLLRFVIGF